LLPENDYQADQAVRFLNKVFEGSTKGLVSTLNSRNLLSKSEYNELLSQWGDDDGVDE